MMLGSGVVRVVAISLKVVNTTKKVRYYDDDMERWETDCDRR